jgi:hypothetical protein
MNKNLLLFYLLIYRKYMIFLLLFILLYYKLNFLCEEVYALDHDIYKDIIEQQISDENIKDFDLNDKKEQNNIINNEKLEID